MLHLLLRFQSEASVRIQWVGFFHLRNPWLWTLKTFPETLNQKVVRGKWKSNAFVVCSRQPQQTPISQFSLLQCEFIGAFISKSVSERILKMDFEPKVTPNSVASQLQVLKSTRTLLWIDKKPARLRPFNFLSINGNLQCNTNGHSSSGAAEPRSTKSDVLVHALV